MQEKDRISYDREDYLLELYSKASKGNQKSFEKLNQIAFGRNDIPLSRKLVALIESEKIKFNSEEENSESDFSYGIKHFVNYLRVKLRQLEVSIEHAQPPTGSNFEDFPNLPVAEAARLMGLRGGGVQLEDWPTSVREEMKAGKIIHPDGRIPEHKDL